MIDASNSTTSYKNGLLKVAVVMTGGTIAKSYDPNSARLYNFELKVKEIITSLSLPDLEFTFVDLMHLDSLEIGDEERAQITRSVTSAAATHDAVIITHGTDSMALSGEALCCAVKAPRVPVIFTGAMVPYVIEGSDASQNMIEALVCARLLQPGIYIAFHNRVLTLPGARKDHSNLTFTEA
ncbi:MULTISPECIES: asparaginase domain-containing protein [unclassified Pseudovibrio]|uniref:asparaginase domain-containing protein n=1 Tax=unclassified Pseudovibrio TaxID=2627060 RepID=UPI0007B1C539|nr:MULTISPECIES: asparaginase domain-containing protein [unclassified Pseudovibrio]KZK95296.1 L-asparaginase 1 [Pseudovibrio sp. W74]KZL07278.1 L-asparaginase 1 [Pseudovibrio sp. Ad14]